ncbi:hypothetical protein DYH09_17705 [bacterium CPR1]|nr:hypothetical protein [bacterium CPR1]
MPGWRPRPRIPVDDSFAGLLQALESEKEEIRPTKLELEACSPLGVTDFVLRVHPAYVRQLRDDHEGWTAAGEKSAGGYPWAGDVINVDTDAGLLVVRKTGGGLQPVAGRPIFLYEPDYQALVRRWVMERLKSPLPEPYHQLTRNAWESLASPAEILTWAARDTALRPAQRTAVAAAGGSVALIWGPPGTGKTFTLGAAAAALSLSGRKVLVLAPTNSAADQATLAIDDARNRLLAPLETGELLRPGRPTHPDLESRAHLLAWTSALREASRGIRSLRETVAELQKEVLRTFGPDREGVNHRLGSLKDQLRQSEEMRGRKLWQLAREARMIVTTLTAGLHHPEVLKVLQMGSMALFLDEASMVSRYALVPFLSTSPEHLALFGDFRQLGPIRRNDNPNDANSLHWVGDSCFDLVGARTESDLSRLEKRGSLVMLTDQNRCHDGLCQPLSRAFYRGKLTTLGSPPLPPLISGWPAGAHLLVDPWQNDLPATAPHTVSQAVDRASHRCERSAWICLRVVSQVLERRPETSVLVLSPFRLQADLMRKLVRAHLSHFPQVRAGTVHISQGQEADLVVFDPVEPRHAWFMGKFGQREIERLLCVAFSRARIQMVVVGKQAEIRSSPLLGLLCQAAQPMAL